MTPQSDCDNASKSPSSLAQFVRDLVAFSGRKGFQAIILVGLGAFFETLSLAVLVPLLSVAIGSDIPSVGRIGEVAARLFRIFGTPGPTARLALLLCVFGLLIVVRAVVLSFRDASLAGLQTYFVEAQRLRIVESLAGAQWNQIVRLQHARVTHLMSSEIQRIGDVTHLLLRSTALAAMLAAQFVLALILAPIFASLALALLVIGSLVFFPFVRRAHMLGRLLTDANLSLVDITTQFLGGLKIAMSQNLQSRFIDEFRHSQQDLARRKIEFRYQESYARNALTILSAIAAAFLIFIGFSTFHLPTATLITLVVIIARMINPIGQIQQDVQQIGHFLPAYEKALELEYEFAAISHNSGQPVTEMPVPEGAITFEHVSYQYNPSEGPEGKIHGVCDINLTIHRGEIVGITGPSGAGKTTFADLLVGLSLPQEGRITVAGVELGGPLLAAWRNQLSYVSQDPFLFHDTIRNNMTWVNPRASDDAIWDALSFVGADDIVRAMPLGLDSVVGERGSLVSGGERQRIALARGIIRQPRLLVLDEATGAIDVDGERKVLENLQKLSNRPTIIIVAHRLDSLRLCERILRFEAGRLVHAEFGSAST